MLQFRVEHDSSSYDCGEYDSSDEWDRPDTTTDHTIGSYFYKSDYADLVLKDEPEDGEEMYVVYVIYSTGDSFGSDSGNGLEWIGLYHTEKQAKKIVSIINKARSHNLTYTDTYGNKIKMDYVPWEGYFESLDSVDYKSVTYKKEV